MLRFERVLMISKATHRILQRLCWAYQHCGCYDLLIWTVFASHLDQCKELRGECFAQITILTLSNLTNCIGSYLLRPGRWHSRGNVLAHSRPHNRRSCWTCSIASCTLHHMGQYRSSDYILGAYRIGDCTAHGKLFGCPTIRWFHVSCSCVLSVDAQSVETWRA